MDEYHKIEDWEEKPELKQLLGIKPEIKVLYYQGTWDEQIFDNCVAVVGSRRMTEYGRRVIDKLVPQLVLQKKTIVSGFMYGVDQYAHQVAVESGGKTIAVLGWGISEKLQAASDKLLAKNIISAGGLLLSEWEEQKAALWTFPQRNRIVAGLCSEVYVIEAAMKSGSLITAALATKMGRTLWAVPGPITSKTSEGTNWLIATGRAKMWLAKNDQETRSKNQTTSHNPILQVLMNEEMTANDLARKLSKPVAEIGAQLSLLTITGEVVEREGKYYSN